MSVRTYNCASSTRATRASLEPRRGSHDEIISIARSPDELKEVRVATPSEGASLYHPGSGTMYSLHGMQVHMYIPVYVRTYAR